MAKMSLLYWSPFLAAHFDLAQKCINYESPFPKSTDTNFGKIY